MLRRRPSALVLLAVSLSTLTLAACSSAPEKPILNQFFTASRLRDNTSLQNFATVVFDSRTAGTVTSFDITGVTAEQRKPLNLRPLAKAFDDAKANDAAYTKRKEDYLRANQEAVGRALKAEREKTTLRGKDGEVQAAWVKIREEGTQVSKKVYDARTRLAGETALAELSFSDQRNPPDVKKYDGELVSKDVSVSAPVKLPGGQTVQKTLVITMQRVILKGDKDIAGRWVITNVKDAAAIPASTKSS